MASALSRACFVLAMLRFSSDFATRFRTPAFILECSRMRPCSRRVHVYLHARVYPDHLKTGDALRERAYSSVILINRAFDIEH